jgi:hypothetical protein
LLPSSSNLLKMYSISSRVKFLSTRVKNLANLHYQLRFVTR